MEIHRQLSSMEIRPPEDFNREYSVCVKEMLELAADVAPLVEFEICESSDSPLGVTKRSNLQAQLVIQHSSGQCKGGCRCVKGD
jgi:hypothetical protein